MIHNVILFARKKGGKFIRKVAQGIRAGKFRKIKSKRARVTRFVMGKFKRRGLHRRGRGGKRGPAVKDKRQALAIALNTARQLGFAGLERVHIDSTFRARRLKVFKRMRRKKRLDKK